MVRGGGFKGILRIKAPPQCRGTTIPITDRAARCICDLLVELGLALELTGQSISRSLGFCGPTARAGLTRLDGADRSGTVC